MPWFAQYQPFTPVNNTVRRLLLGGHVGTDWIIALGWRLGITAVGDMCAKRLYDRRSTR